MPSKKQRHFQKHNHQQPQQHHNNDQSDAKEQQASAADHSKQAEEDAAASATQQEQQQQQEEAEEQPKGRYEDIKTTAQIIEILIERFIPYSNAKKRFSFFWGLHPFEPAHDITLTDEQVCILIVRHARTRA